MGAPSRVSRTAASVVCVLVLVAFALPFTNVLQTDKTSRVILIRIKRGATRSGNETSGLWETAAAVPLQNVSRKPTVQDSISRFPALVILDNNPYFAYVAKALGHTFTKLGVNHTVSKDVPAGTNATFITFLTHDLGVALPQHYISYNFEQLTTDKPWPDQFWQRLRAADIVWDYSLENIKVLNAHGINNTYHVPLGYDETMEANIPAPPQRDLDVVFAGAMNEKRAAKLAQLQGPIGPNGSHLRTDFQGAWGDGLLALYKRSKVALNLHFYGGRTILEVHRILPIIISKTLVLSEPSDDQWLDSIYQGMVNFTTGDDIRHSLVSMLQMDVEAEVERRYQQLLQCCRYSRYLEDMLLQPFPRQTGSSA